MKLKLFKHSSINIFNKLYIQLLIFFSRNYTYARKVHENNSLITRLYDLSFYNLVPNTSLFFLVREKQCLTIIFHNNLAIVT